MKVISRPRSSTTSDSYTRFIMKRRNRGEARATASRVCLNILWRWSLQSGRSSEFFRLHQTAGHHAVVSPMRSAKNAIPKTGSDAKVHAGNFMVNEMMGPQFSITAILQMKMMMHVMEQTITNEP